MSDYIEHLCEYLQSRFDLRSELMLYRTPVATIAARHKIVIFVQKFKPEMLGPATGDRRVFLLNTEQATVPTVGATINAINKYNICVLDYSLENISILQKRCPKAIFIHFPFPFKPTDKKHEKTNTFIGLLSSNYRKNSVGNLPVTNFKGQWGNSRDKMIAASKILVNVHYSPKYEIFESIRCYHALEMRTLVVSQTSLNNELVMCKEMIIFAKPDELVEKLKHVEKNYQLYYDTIFSEKNIAAVANKFTETFRRAIDQLTGFPCNF